MRSKNVKPMITSPAPNFLAPFDGFSICCHYISYENASVQAGSRGWKYATSRPRVTSHYKCCPAVCQFFHNLGAFMPAPEKNRKVDIPGASC
jgi:hypothetical protein